MVTMNQGIREVRESGSRFIHRMEAGVMAVYDWMSGTPTTEQERLQAQLHSTELIRRFPESLV